MDSHSYYKMPGTKKFHPKFKFSAEEDIQLRSLVNQYGINNWQTISQNMANRNPRQCKERWCNYLSPQISKCPWTPDEDALIIQKVKELGSRWVQIAKYFNQRTDTSIKNRWLVLVRKNKRDLQKQQTIHPISSAPTFQEESNPILINNSQLSMQRKSSETSLLPPISSLPFVHCNHVQLVEKEITNPVFPQTIIPDRNIYNSQPSNIHYAPSCIPPSYLLPPKKAILAVQTQMMFLHQPNAAAAHI